MWEPAEPIDADLVRIVATATERKSIAEDLLQCRVLFAVKKAVYKAVYPLDGVFLEHHDVEVSLTDGIATTRTGRPVRFRYCVSSPHCGGGVHLGIGAGEGNRTLVCSLGSCRSTIRTTAREVLRQ